MVLLLHYDDRIFRSVHILTVSGPQCILKCLNVHVQPPYGVYTISLSQLNLVDILCTETMEMINLV